uniref:Uncharacterized protein n=1 Tax=Brassica oleracea var. oleracea TaxID=109376 RepID=A0A0D2ZSW4_BRAOL
MGDSQISLIPLFLDDVKKSRVRSRCFSHPFAKLRALLLAEMIDKGEESMEEISKVKLNDYNKALSERQPTIRSKKKEFEEDEFARGSTMVAQHRSTEHH